MKNLACRAIHLLVLASLSAFSSSPAVAAGSWTSLGPDGGLISALIVHPRQPQVVYAGTRSNGVFKSTDAGRTWKESSQGLGLPGQTGVLMALEIDPLRPEILYAVTLTAVYKSTDGGGRWVRAVRGLPGATSFQSLALDPRNPSLLYLGTTAGVARSRNGAATWQRTGLELPAGITALAVDPSTGWVYAGGDGGHRLHWSQDGGARWQPLDRGLPPGIAFRALEPAALAGRTVLFAGTSRGLYRSENRGLRWTRVGTQILTGTVESLAFDGRTGSLYAGTRAEGLFASRDRGATWQPASTGLGEPFVKALATGPGAVYAATRRLDIAAGGVYKSTDLGSHWGPSQAGLTAQGVSTVAASPAVPGLLYATGGEIWRSGDSGRSWRHLDGAPEPVGVKRAIALDPAAPATVYAVSSVPEADGVGVRATFLRSDDFGESWEAFPLPAALEHLWVDAAGTIWGISLQALYRSDDRGRTWSRQTVESGSQLLLYDIQGDPASPSTLYLAGGRTDGFIPPFPARLYRSDDRGATWRRKDSGIFSSALKGLTADPVDATLHAWSDGGIFRSTDRGESWEDLGLRSELGFFTAVAPSPPGSSTLFVATGSPETGVLRSTDGGETWMPANQGLGVARAVSDLAGDPADPARLYAATPSGGVFVYTEN